MEEPTSTLRSADVARLYRAGLISRAECEALSYYELESVWPRAYRDVLGVQEMQKDPLLLKLRLLHIDEIVVAAHNQEPKALLDASATATHESTDQYSRIEAGLYCTMTELALVSRFLERWVGDPPPTADDLITHFKLITVVPNAGSWYATREPDQLKLFDPSYHYLPSATISHTDRYAVTLSLPGWRAGMGPGDVGKVYLFSFERSDLSDPEFDPYVTYGLGFIILDRPALRDLVTLFKRILATAVVRRQ